MSPAFESGRLIRRIAASALFVVPVGILLHYVYEWTGRATVAGIFAPLNESTWEHLKLAFWPMLLIAPLQWWRYARPAGWLPATAVRLIAAPLLIIILFYSYTAILGNHYLPIDVAIFVLAVIGGEILGHLIMHKSLPAWLHVAAAIIILAMAGAMIVFSFAPPDWLLFRPPA